MKFRKKPVVIEAVQFTEEMALGTASLPEGVRFCARSVNGDQKLTAHSHKIKTLEGDMQVQIGDWVITGVKGEHYPCKPGIFAATYEPAEQPL